MPELTLHHIDQISRDINRQEIVFSHLLHDLIDHVCCDVEEEMQNGLTFQDAYRKVNLKMGFRRLKEIQEETLFLVYTKYRNMKNTMKISGVAGTVMLGFAALFKIQHWPAAGIILTVGALLLAFVFLPSSLGVLWKETHSSKRLFLFISSFITGMLVIFGTLFKIQHWPGAGIVISIAAITGIFLLIPSLLASKLRGDENRPKRSIYIFFALGSAGFALGLLFKIQHWPFSAVLMITGLILLFFIAFPWYVWYTWKDEKNVSARFIFILVGALAIIVPAALINMNLSRNFDAGFFIQIQQQQAMYNYKVIKNQSVIKEIKDSVAISVAEQIHSKTIDLLQIIGDIESKMVAESEGKPGLLVLNPPQVRVTESGSEIQYKLLTHPFLKGPVKDFLLPGCKYRQKLDEALTGYKSYLSGLTSGGETKRFTGLIDSSDYLPGDDPGSSEISLMTGLHSLLLLKNSLLTVELYSLASIQKQ